MMDRKSARLSENTREFNGYEVEEAADGMEAVSLCRIKRLRPDYNGYNDA